jgi:hypothetical protein
MISAPDNGMAAFKLGADAVLDMPDTDRFNKLHVAGIFLSEGEIKLALNNSTDLCDKVIATLAVNVSSATCKLTLRWVAANPLPGNGITWELLNSQNSQASVLPPAANITPPNAKISVKRTPDVKFINAVYTP